VRCIKNNDDDDDDDSVGEGDGDVDCGDDDSRPVLTARAACLGP